MEYGLSLVPEATETGSESDVFGNDSDIRILGIVLIWVVASALCADSFEP